MLTFISVKMKPHKDISILGMKDIEKEVFENSTERYFCMPKKYFTLLLQ